VTIFFLLRGFQVSAGTSDCSLDRRPKGMHKFINAIAYRAIPCIISLVKALIYEPNDDGRGRKKHKQISEIKRERKNTRKFQCPNTYSLQRSLVS
jgi:hypothetical protein